MKKNIFNGVGTAIITPFNEDFSVNYNKMQQLIEFQIGNKADCIVVCGTTGEASTLSAEEYEQVVRFTVKIVNKRVPVVAGSGTNCTKTSISRSLLCEKLGVNGLLVITPYYNKTSQEGLVAHFKAIANEVSLPILLYNVPSRTSMNIDIDTYKKLAEIENIVGTKEASGNFSLIASIRKELPKDFAIYSGNDDQIIPILSLGGNGVISVASNVIPKDIHNICSLYFEKKYSESLDLQLSLLDFINSLFLDVNPVPVKQCLNLLGVNVGSARLPLVDMSEQNTQKLKSVMTDFNLI